MELQKILGEFDSISLEEMDSVKLLNRMDTKFTFRVEFLPDILSQLKNDYRVLDVNGIKLNKYETLYFDTEDLNLYLNHHNHRLNRFKIRYRRYADSDLKFMELKFKNNKGRSIKERIKLKEFTENIPSRLYDQCKSITSNLPQLNLKPVLWVYYTRITFVNKHLPERLTIDCGLKFSNHNIEKEFSQIVIAEVKQWKAKSSPFVSIMKRDKIKNSSVSKYCLGITSLFEHIKKNNFKRKIHELNKLCHENN